MLWTSTILVVWLRGFVSHTLKPSIESTFGLTELGTYYAALLFIFQDSSTYTKYVSKAMKNIYIWIGVFVA